MHSVKLLSVLLCVLFAFTIIGAAPCPPNGGYGCYPSDCSEQYIQCVGDRQFFTPVAPGTRCKGGVAVHASECPATPPVQPVTKPPQPPQPPIVVVTPAPATVKPTTAAPTAAPTVKPTTAAPTTAAPTVKPTTAAPTAAPTVKPTTAAPTVKPTTSAPTAAPTTAPTPPVQATTKPTVTVTQPPSTCSLSQILTPAMYAAMFPHLNGASKNRAVYGANQHAIFDYEHLIQAAAAFPAFSCTGTLQQRKLEVASFLAHTSQETTGWWPGQVYEWGHFFSTEACGSNCNTYCDSWNTEYPCAAGKAYYGRGPIQLSWNYNYGQVSKHLYGDDRLLKNPDQLFDSAGTAFKTALWFWMTTQNPKPACHDLMTNSQKYDMTKYGFGATTMVINGGIECGTQNTTPQQVLNRVGYLTRYATIMGVDLSNINLYCNRMSPFTN